MIPKDCKRLAEVDFPIAEVSRHAVREEGIKARHPRGLHLWWARRPLASCRAVLLGLLWPDPCDPLCPAAFKTEARRRLREVGGCNPGSTDHDLRQALLRFLADFASWDNALQRTYVEVSRALVRAAYTAGNGSGYEPPLVLDPFAGGGAIPLEAMRLGCDAVACDLNPIPVLINAVQLEHVPRFGMQLADEFRRWSVRLFDLLREQLSDLYPGDDDGALPIAYLWARTILCTGPNCGADIPLIKQTVISRRRGVTVRIVPSAGRILTQIVVGAAAEPSLGTVRGGRVQCPSCGTVIAGDEYRARAMAGQLGERIYGVVLSTRDGSRQYRDPLQRDIDAFEAARSMLARLEASDPGFVPQASISASEPRRLNVRYYGFTKWSQLFNERQKLFLRALGAALRQVRHEMISGASGGGLEDGVHAALALSISNTLQYNSNMSTWLSDGMISVFIQSSSIPMRADYAEANPLMDRLVGGLRYQFNKTSEALENIAQIRATGGSAMSASATTQVYPHESVDIIATDPPYYFAIPYAELSDFFYVWLAHFMRDVKPSLFAEPETPKADEAIQNLAHSKAPAQKDRAHFEATIRSSLAAARSEIKGNGVCLVVFAHASTEGWEALVASLLAAGWTITASWPIETERGGRMLAQRQTSLATSIHLVCRPRPDDASVGDWTNVLRELPNRVGDWMERLQGEGVRGADLVFACIGPALEIFSRYTKVETADGREVALAEYLQKVWEVVGRSALAQVLGTAEAKARNGAAGAVEEDARLTALFLWTLQDTNGATAEPRNGATEDEQPPDEDEDGDEEGSSRRKAKGFTLVFDVVRRFAQPLGIDLPKWEGRVIETKKGVVRLLPIAERAKQLFGKDGAQAVAARLEQEVAVPANPLQGMLFPDFEAAPKVRGRARGRGRLGGVEVSDESLATAREATTLDRVHAAMLLQAGGRTNALRALLKAEQERGSDFLRLANAFSALYPKGSEEKRLVDAMLLAVPR
jgi:adenine-specific DNA methylase